MEHAIPEGKKLLPTTDETDVGICLQACASPPAPAPQQDPMCWSSPATGAKVLAAHGANKSVF